MKAYLLVSGSLFGLVGVAHLLRLVIEPAAIPNPSTTTPPSRSGASQAPAAHRSHQTCLSRQCHGTLRQPFPAPMDKVPSLDGANAPSYGSALPGGAGSAAPGALSGYRCGGWPTVGPCQWASSEECSVATPRPVLRNFHRRLRCRAEPGSAESARRQGP